MTKLLVTEYLGEQEEAPLRFVLAISALVLSGIMLILGIGQVTFFSGPHEIVYSTKFDAPGGIAVVDAEQFEGVEGQANLAIDGGSPFVAMAQSRDIDAWVAPFAHGRIVADSETRGLQLDTVQPVAEAAEAYAEAAGVSVEEITTPSPRGSDLWLVERVIEAPAAEEGEAETDAGEVTGETELQHQALRLPVALNADQSLLVTVDVPVVEETAEAAADSTEAAVAPEPAQISIVWVQDRDTPWAGPLLAAGGALAVIGAVLYLLAVDHDRRGLGPRRGRRGPLQGIRNVFSRKGDGKAQSKGSMLSRAALPALALTGAVLLAGCSQSYWPDLSPEPEEVEEVETTEATNLAPVPVTQDQIDRIIADIAEVAGTADAALDPAGLDTRFTADALAERTANYKIRSAVSDYEVIVPTLSSEALGYQLVQSTVGWPRTVFVIVASVPDADAATAEEAADEAETGEEAAAEEATEEAASEEEAQEVAGSPSIALIMTQASPHENYLVSRAIALRGGITMPEAAPAEEGTALLADDLQTLLVTPAEVGPAYATVLAGGTEVEEAALFEVEGDSLIERSGAAWVAQSTEAASAAEQGIKYSVTAAQSDTSIVSLSTGVGGALVATTVLETRVEEPEEDSRWRPTVPETLEALSGLEGQQDKLVSVVAHQLLFFVPGGSDENNEHIQLLGYTSDLISASDE